MNSGSWWWTGRPSVLRFMGSQRVGHDWVTELNCTEHGLMWSWYLDKYLTEFLTSWFHSYALDTIAKTRLIHVREMNLLWSGLFSNCLGTWIKTNSKCVQVFTFLSSLCRVPLNIGNSEGSVFTIYLIIPQSTDDTSLKMHTCLLRSITCTAVLLYYCISQFPEAKILLSA